MAANDHREAASTSSFVVAGMSCGHCVTAVQQEVGRLPAVTAVEVDLAAGGLTFTSTGPVDETAVRSAVEEAGYNLVDG